MKARMTLGKYLNDRGIKAVWLAKQIDSPPEQVSRWINNHSLPSLTKAMLIAKVLDCTIEEICTLDG